MKKRIQGLSFLFAFILMIVSAAGCSGGKSFPADESAGSTTGEGTISGEEPEQPEKKVTLREIGKTWDALGEFSQDLCPAKDSESGRWGFVDKTGQWIIDPQYHDVRNFREDLAAVNVNGKWGFVDRSGNIAVELQYDGVGDSFMYGRVYAQIGDDWYSLDKAGNRNKNEQKPRTGLGKSQKWNSKILEKDSTRYKLYTDTRELIREGYLASGAAGVPILDKDSKIMNNMSENYLLEKDGNNGSAVIDKNGTVVLRSDMLEEALPEESDSVGLGFTVSEEYLMVSKTVNHITTSAVFDMQGQKVIDYQYTAVCPLLEGYFAVSDANVNSTSIIDRTGKKLITGRYFGFEIYDKQEGIILYRDYANNAAVLYSLKREEPVSTYPNLKEKYRTDLFVYDTYAVGFTENGGGPAGDLQIWSSDGQLLSSEYKFNVGLMERLAGIGGHNNFADGIIPFYYQNTGKFSFLVVDDE